MTDGKFNLPTSLDLRGPLLASVDKVNSASANASGLSA